MATRMQQRRGTAAQWTAANPVLAAGEIGFETDNNRFKIGDGVTAWGSLDYFANSQALTDLLDGAPDALNTLNELAAALGDDPAFFTAVGTNLAAHESDTTNVHGIVNTADLARIGDVASSYQQTTAALLEHEADTTLVHGIADTSLLATLTDVEAASNSASSALGDHESDTTNVHGIANTADLATLTDISDAVAASTVNQENLAGVGINWNSGNEQFDIDSTVATKTYADDAVSAHQSDTTSVHGIADTSELETQTGASAKANNAQTAAEGYADSAVSTAVAALTKSSVGLGNVDNTADTAKPVSTAQATAIATAKSEAIADATSQVNALLTGAPAALNTLDELAAALGDDANFATTVTNGLALKAPIASPTFTGTVTVAAQGVAFTDGTQTKEGVPSRTPIIQKSAGYTLSTLTERDSLIEVSSAGAVTLTIPTNASVAYPVGTTIDILQTSTGQVTIAGAGGVTVNATPGLKLRTTWSSATLLKRAENTWVVFGDLTA